MNGIDAPTVLSVGETGTWNVRATDPQNGTLKYAVDWGDLPGYPAAVKCPEGYSCQPIGVNASVPAVQQNSTFTHAYSDARTYKVTFIVTNDLGLSTRSSVTVKVAAPPPSSLNIISPNGGETWVARSAQDLRWSIPSGMDLMTRVDLYLDAGAPCPTLATSGTSFYCLPTYILDKNIPITMVYHWLVATDINDAQIPNGAYNFRVCVSGSTTQCDSSDRTFTIKY